MGHFFILFKETLPVYLYTHFKFFVNECHLLITMYLLLIHMERLYLGSPLLLSEIVQILINLSPTDPRTTRPGLWERGLGS